MAIYHCSVKIIGRSAGRSAVAAAAYRAGEKLRNERDGLTHNYTRKDGVVHTEILLPDNAPAEFQGRGALWNAVEKSEKRSDSQLAREVEVALPVELSREEQLDAVRQYIAKNFTARGMCADFALHDKSDGNPHAHILLTTREVSAAGFGKKNRDWNDKELLEKWRENWAACNARLPYDARIDHRTLVAQGIDREPTIHIGAAAYAMARRGEDSGRAREQREIVEQNESQRPERAAERLNELTDCYIALDREILALQAEYTERRGELWELRTRAESLDERAANIAQMRDSVAELRAERQAMRFWQWRKKKIADGRIESAEKSIERAKTAFARDYGFAPDRADVELERIEARIAELAAMPPPDIAPFAKLREAVAAEYRAQRRVFEAQVGETRARELLQKPDESPRTRLDRSRAERTLNGDSRDIERLPPHWRSR